MAGITVAELLGTVGGNLGMFTGMSFMTILELFEVGAGGASWRWGRGAGLGVRGGAGRGLDCTCDNGVGAGRGRGVRSGVLGGPGGSGWDGMLAQRERRRCREGRQVAVAEAREGEALVLRRRSLPQPASDRSVPSDAAMMAEWRVERPPSIPRPRRRRRPTPHTVQLPTP